MLDRLFAALGRARDSDAETSALDDRDALKRARKFEHYWYNAQKKLDLRRLEGFGPLAARVRSEGRTYLHIDRLYTLWQAVVAMPPSARAVIEVGVYEGGSTRFIAEALRMRGYETMPIVACDTFSGHAVVDESVDGRHVVGKQFVNVSVEDVRAYLRPHANVRVVPGDIHETSGSLEDMRDLGLAHIDVDVYPPTKHCLDVFAPRVVVGGTIVVDDYGFKTCPGARKAVDEFAAAHPEFRLWHLMTGQAILVRLGS
jgi:hypothetical protein